MENKIDVVKEYSWFYDMPKSRPADFCLAYDNGSVFIDFNNFDDQRITLARISFDGYGCCNVEGKFLVLMDGDEAIDFKNMFTRNQVDQKRMMQIISKLLSENKEDLWEDVLLEYKLI